MPEPNFLSRILTIYRFETGRPTLRAALYRPPHPCYNASRLVFTPSPSTEGDKPASLCSFDLSDLAIRLAVL